MADFSSLDLQFVRNRLEHALSSPQNIAPLPRICEQLAELDAQGETDAINLVKVIQSDPVLTGEVLRVANSPAMRLRSAVISLPQSVSWLGMIEVRNIAMATALRSEVFTAAGRESDRDEIWHQAWLGGLWAREVARSRRKHVETAFLAGLMHRSGAALVLKVIAKFEAEKELRLSAEALENLITDFEPAFGRLLMSNWRLTEEVQVAAVDWRGYPESRQDDLVGTIAAAHLLVLNTLHPLQLADDAVLASPILAQLGIFPDDRARLLEKRDAVRQSAGF